MLKLRVCVNHLKSLSLSAASTRALSTHTPSIGITRPQSSSSAASKTPSSTTSFEQDDEYDHMKAYTDGKKSYTTSCSEYHLVPSTIREVLEQAAKDHDRKMVYGFPHQGLNLSFSEVQQRVNLLAQNLLELGFRKGDRLAISLPNTYELVITFLAASEIGLISVILNPAYQLSEFEYMLKKSGARGLVIYDSFKTLQHMEIMRRLCPEIDHSEPGQLSSKTLPDLKHVFVLNSPLVPTKSTYKGTWDFSRLLEKSQRNEKHILPYVDIDDPCLILFTSGTTGKPKGALMSHSNLLNSAYLSTVVVGKREGLRMICNPVPFFHIFGLSTGVLIPLLMGTSIVFPFYFPETLSSMKAIQGYKCNTMRGTPTQFVDVINHPEREKLNISSLENGIIGASTVPPDLLQKMKNVLNLKEIIVGYGMTETSLCHSVTTYTDKLKSHKYAYESIGRPIPFSETKIVDSKTGHIVPLGVDGEVCIRGPHIIKEYWDEKEKTAQAIDENGWLHTGDVCCMDSDGYLYFKSRDKDIIIRGGANLYPAEIESFIRTHPEVVDAQVFGVPDERLGEEISIWIKLKPNSKLTEEDIKAFCKDKISHFKVPKYYKFVEQFPTNANNKMLKNVMREKMIAELKL